MQTRSDQVRLDVEMIEVPARTDAADPVPSLEAVKQKAHENLRNAWRTDAAPEDDASRTDADADAPIAPSSDVGQMNRQHAERMRALFQRSGK